MPDAFFQVTKNSLVAFSSLCDIMHPVTVSMWNTRSQVIGTYTVSPSVAPKQIAAKYELGCKIHGVNYKKVFVETPWEDHEQNIAWLFLNGIFPIFEGWLTDLRDKVFTTANGNLDVQAMQYPSSRASNILTEITRLTATECDLIKDAFYSSYASKKHRSFSNLDNLLICYRFFKEMRNCYMHNAMVADDKLINAYTPFSNLSPADLNMSEIPAHTVPIKGEKVKVNLRGVIGFSQVVLQIMLTCDNELLRSSFAEKELLDRLKKVAPSKLEVSNKKERALRQVKGMIIGAGFVVPSEASIEKIAQLLVTNNIIYPYR